jgi:hypothetical protein
MKFLTAGKRSGVLTAGKRSGVLTAGERFLSDEGVFTIRRVLPKKKNCLVQWDYRKGQDFPKDQLWTLSSSEILDPTRASPIRSSKYPALHVSQRVTKKRANEMFIRETMKKEGKVAYLDAEDANTTKNFQRLCPEKRRVAINYDTKVCQEILEIADGNLTIFRGDMGSFVTEQNPGSFHVWFDYCGTPSGNKKMKPLEDIQKAIDCRIFLRNGGIAAFTFCLRDSKRKNDMEVQDEILDMFKQAYPRSQIVHIFRYQPSMVFFMIRV